MARRRILDCAALCAVVTVTGAAPLAQATTIPPGAVAASEITFPSAMIPVNSYTPKLVAIDRTGANPASMSWSGPFGSHPLLFENVAVAANRSGSSATRQLRSGRYAYYCSFHGGPNGVGMSGEVYVAGPRAALTATPADIAPGGTVKLDAATTDLVSVAPTTATYAFDPEGDGTFLPASSETSMQATYPAEGSFAARVRVTDADGRIDEDAFDIDVAPPGVAPGPPVPPTDPANPDGPPSQSRPLPPAPSGAAVKFADLATVPVFGRCVSRRRGVRITVRDRAGADVRAVRILVNGRTVKRASSVSPRATLTIRPLPRGRPLVKVVVTLSSGKKLTRSIRYRTCRR